MCFLSLSKKNLFEQKRMRRKSMGETAAAWLDWGMRNHGEKSTRKSACDPKGTQATPPTIAISALICHFVFVLFVSACKNIVFCLYSQTFVCFSFKKSFWKQCVWHVFDVNLLSSEPVLFGFVDVWFAFRRLFGGVFGGQSGRFTSELTIRTS